MDIEVILLTMLMKGKTFLFWIILALGFTLIQVYPSYSASENDGGSKNAEANALKAKKLSRNFQAEKVLFEAERVVRAKLVLQFAEKASEKAQTLPSETQEDEDLWIDQMSELAQSIALENGPKKRTEGFFKHQWNTNVEKYRYIARKHGRGVLVFYAASTLASYLTPAWGPAIGLNTEIVSTLSTIPWSTLSTGAIVAAKTQSGPQSYVRANAKASKEIGIDGETKLFVPTGEGTYKINEPTVWSRLAEIIGVRKQRLHLGNLKRFAKKHDLWEPEYETVLLSNYFTRPERTALLLSLLLRKPGAPKNLSAMLKSEFSKSVIVSSEIDRLGLVQNPDLIDWAESALMVKDPAELEAVFKTVPAGTKVYSVALLWQDFILESMLHSKQVSLKFRGYRHWVRNTKKFMERAEISAADDWSADWAEDFKGSFLVD